MSISSYSSSRPQLNCCMCLFPLCFEACCACPKVQLMSGKSWVPLWKTGCLPLIGKPINLDTCPLHLWMCTNSSFHFTRPHSVPWLNGTSAMHAAHWYLPAATWTQWGPLFTSPPLDWSKEPNQSRSQLTSTLNIFCTSHTVTLETACRFRIIKPSYIEIFSFLCILQKGDGNDETVTVSQFNSRNFCIKNCWCLLCVLSAKFTVRVFSQCYQGIQACTYKHIYITV